MVELGRPGRRLEACIGTTLTAPVDPSIRPQSGGVASAEASYFDRLAFTGDVIPPAS